MTAEAQREPVIAVIYPSVGISLSSSSLLPNKKEGREIKAAPTILNNAATIYSGFISSPNTIRARNIVTIGYNDSNVVASPRGRVLRV